MKEIDDGAVELTMLQTSNVIWAEPNPAHTPLSRSICRRIKELRCLRRIWAVAHILRDFSLAPVPWMILCRTTERSSLRHEAVLFLTSESGAPVARLYRAPDARRVLIAKKALEERFTGTPSTAKAYTGPTTGLRPES